MGTSSLIIPTVAISASGVSIPWWDNYSEKENDVTLYRLILKSETKDNIYIPMSSFQYRLYSDGRAYLSAAIPTIGEYVQEISERIDGEIIIEQGIKRSNSVARYIEMVRTGVKNVRYDRGGRNGSITITGGDTAIFSINSSIDRYIKSVSNENLQNNGELTIRTLPLLGLLAGDVVNYDGQFRLVDYIAVFVNVNTAQMEIKFIAGQVSTLYTLKNNTNVNQTFDGAQTTTEFLNKLHTDNPLRITTVNTYPTWADSLNPLPSSIRDAQSFVTKGYAHMVAGNGGTSAGKCYTAPINEDGTLGAWTTGSDIPSPLYSSQSVVLKNRVYLFCGSDGVSSTNKVFMAEINTDGTLANWLPYVNFPINLAGASCFVTKNRIYMVGGVTENEGVISTLDTIYTAQINADETIGSWILLNHKIPIPIQSAQSVIIGDKAYIIGGMSTDFNSSRVYVANIDNDGFVGDFSRAQFSLPHPVFNFSTVTTKNRIFLIGGLGGSSSSPSSHSAPIDDFGNIGSWSAPKVETTLSAAVTYTRTLVTNGYIHLLGGFATASYSAPFADGWKITKNEYTGSALI